MFRYFKISVPSKEHTKPSLNGGVTYHGTVWQEYIFKPIGTKYVIVGVVVSGLTLDWPKCTLYRCAVDSPAYLDLIDAGYEAEKLTPNFEIFND